VTGQCYKLVGAVSKMYLIPAGLNPYFNWKHRIKKNVFK